MLGGKGAEGVSSAIAIAVPLAVAGLLLKEAGIKKGSSNAKSTKVGHISQAQLRKIAEYKLPDLNCNDVEAAMKVVAGSARNMGIVIDD